MADNGKVTRLRMTGTRKGVMPARPLCFGGHSREACTYCVHGIFCADTEKFRQFHAKADATTALVRLLLGENQELMLARNELRRIADVCCFDKVEDMVENYDRVCGEAERFRNALENIVAYTSPNAGDKRYAFSNKMYEISSEALDASPTPVVNADGTHKASCEC